MLVEQPGVQHDRVERQHPGMVGHDERRAGVRDVLQPAHADAEPLPVDRPGQRHDHRGVEVGIETGLVDLVVPLGAAAHEVRDGSDPLSPFMRVIGMRLAHHASPLAPPRVLVQMPLACAPVPPARALRPQIRLPLPSVRLPLPSVRIRLPSVQVRLPRARRAPSQDGPGGPAGRPADAAPAKRPALQPGLPPSRACPPAGPALQPAGHPAQQACHRAWLLVTCATCSCATSCSCAGPGSSAAACGASSWPFACGAS